MSAGGEAAGVLDEVMASLAGFAQRDLALRQKLQSASLYPLMVLGLGIISIVIILTWILPPIFSSVTESGALLPMPTRVLLAVSEFLRSPAGLLLWPGVFAGAWGFARWARQPRGRLALDRLKLKAPLVGMAVRRVAAARLARTVGTLTRSGIPVVEALRVTRDTLGNEAIAQALDGVTAGIAQGQSIAERLGESDCFPPLLIQIIAMGEQTGRLDELLLQAADAYEAETAAALERVMTVVPVLFILDLALVVAFILAAVLLPIVNLDMAGGGL